MTSGEYGYNPTLANPDFRDGPALKANFSGHPSVLYHSITMWDNKLSLVTCKAILNKYPTVSREQVDQLGNPTYYSSFEATIPEIHSPLFLHSSEDRHIEWLQTTSLACWKAKYLHHFATLFLQLLAVSNQQEVIDMRVVPVNKERTRSVQIRIPCSELKAITLRAIISIREAK